MMMEKVVDADTSGDEGDLRFCVPRNPNGWSRELVVIDSGINKMRLNNPFYSLWFFAMLKLVIETKVEERIMVGY